MKELITATRERILSTAEEMYLFNMTTYTNTELKTDFEDFCEEVCESFENCFIHYGAGGPDITFHILGGGKIKVVLTFYTYIRKDHKEANVVEQEVNTILNNILKYIDEKMNIYLGEVVGRIV